MTTENLDMDYSKYDFKDSTEMYVHLSKKGLTKDYEQTGLVDVLHKTSIIAIGPFTADELKKLNVENVIADVHTVSGAFDAVRNIFIS